MERSYFIYIIIIMWLKKKVKEIEKDVADLKEYVKLHKEKQIRDKLISHFTEAWLELQKDIYYLFGIRDISYIVIKNSKKIYYTDDIEELSMWLDWYKTNKKKPKKK